MSSMPSSLTHTNFTLLVGRTVTGVHTDTDLDVEYLATASVSA